MTSGWQHKGSFVIKFKSETDPDAERFQGRIEHVATSRIAQFESLEEMLRFLRKVLRDVRFEFQQADTLTEEITPADNPLK